MKVEFHTAPVKKFLPIIERFEPKVLDHTARIAAKDCKRKYLFQIVMGFRTKQKAQYFAFGSCYHKFREVLEKTQSFFEAMKAAGELWKKTGGDPGVDTKFSFLTGKRLQATCTLAHEHWEKEKSQGRMKVLSAEQPFQVALKDGKTVIGGRADAIVEWNGKIWGKDYKTCSKDLTNKNTLKNYERSLEPNDQFTGYTVGEGKLQGERCSGQLVEVMMNTDKLGPKLFPMMTSRTPEQLDRWEDETIYLAQVELAMARENDCYIMEEKNCSWCEFRSVCTSPTESGMLYQLKSNFNQKPWDFYSIHESTD